MRYTRPYLTLLFFLIAAIAGAQEILVTPLHKQLIHEKIANFRWANDALKQLEEEVSPYSVYFRKGDSYDPGYLLGRYMMNREEGNRYTHCIINPTETAIDSLYGNAPVPTIIYGFNAHPETEDGRIIPYPQWEELPLYHKSASVWHKIRTTNEEVEIPLTQLATQINSQINSIGLKSAILYWITSKEEYGYLAADIFDLWAKATYHQSAADSSAHAGFYSLFSVDDKAYRDIILSYDFIKPFLREHNYNTSFHQDVFKKLIDSQINRGYPSSNWSALKTSTHIFTVLNLNDTSLKGKYLSSFLQTDSTINKLGQISIHSILQKFLSTDGFWKESPTLHNSVLYEILLACVACENNGRPVFERYPELLKASYAMLDIVFPDFSFPNYGDTDLTYTSMSNSILCAYIAKNKKIGDYDKILGALSTKRKFSPVRDADENWIRLLFEEENPKKGKPTPINQRSGILEHPKLHFLRNGANNDALMGTLYGATYSSNHSDPLSIELYGAGKVMGIDPGKGRDIFDSTHINYYTQWAAHNTVVSAGSSAPERLYRGGITTQNIGGIELQAMEPLPEATPISPICSFIEAKYFERFTKTNQQRTLLLIKPTHSPGYFIDIFRSSNTLMNDYIYHNIGETLEFTTQSGTRLKTTPATLSIVEPDFPGLRYLDMFRAPERNDIPLMATFRLPLVDETQPTMKLFLPEDKAKTYFSALAPESYTAPEPYNTEKTPTLMIRQIGNAWNNPFVVAFSPCQTDKSNLTKVKRIDETNENIIALTVEREGNQRELILQATETTRLFRKKEFAFKGNLGVISYLNDSLQYIYLGKGSTIEAQGIRLQSIGTETIQATVERIDGTFRITSNQPFIFTLLQKGGELKHQTTTQPITIPSTTTFEGTDYQIPIAKNLVVRLDERPFKPAKKKTTTSRRRTRRR